MPVATEWMGRYRPLVAALVQHSNLVQRAPNMSVRLSNGVCLSPPEWQVFEYIIEHEDDDACMNSISEQLGIAQSTFSKIVKVLCSHGLVEKYRTESNRKNIILRPSDTAMALYQHHASTVSANMFREFFQLMDRLPDEDIQTFTEAVERLNASLNQNNRKNQKQRLIRIKQN